MTKRRRRIFRLLAVAAVLLGSLYLTATLSMAPFVRHKLQQLVTDHLHARLEMAQVSYRFPYGVTVRDASFQTDDELGNVELLRVKQIDLDLARLPFRRGPIVIENITVRQPLVHIVRDENGTIIGSHLARRPDEPLPDWRKLKLSDFLRLRHFEIRRATVIFEDRTRPQASPMEWRDLNANLQLQPTSASRYDIRFTGDNEPIANLDLAATADVDAWTIDLSKLAMSARVKRDEQRSPLPAPLQQVLTSLGLEGQVKFEVKGSLPLKDPDAAKFALDAQLDGIRVAPENRDWVLDELSAALHAQFDKDVRFDLSKLNARGMGGRLQLSRASGSFGADWRSWQLDKIDGRISADRASAPAIAPATSTADIKFAFLAGGIDFTASAAGSLDKNGRWPTTAQLVATFDNVNLQPPRFPQPIDKISGCVRMTENETLLVENLAGQYGPDHYVVAQAKVSLAEWPLRVVATDIVARAAVAQPGPVYPRPLDKTMAVLRPNGPIDITGCFSVYRGRGRNEPDFALAIIPRGGGMTLTKHDLRICELHGRLDVAPRLVNVALEGTSVGGTVSANGIVIPRPPRYEDPDQRAPVKYDGRVSLQDIDVGGLCLAMGLIRDDGKPKATGRAAARVQTRGEIPGRGSQSQRTWQDEVVARGAVRIDDGDLWSGEVLSRIVGQTSLAPEALTLSEAAALFDVRDRRLQLDQVAISASAVGVQGSGTVTFDGGLDLSVIVAPLGDWRERMKKTGLPIVSDVAGEVVGAIQQLLNTATSQLLYQFRVEGTAKDPRISAVPAPMLTEGAAQLFETMLRGDKSEKLAEQIGENHSPEGEPATQPSGERP
jgi:hypothetical protein